MTRRQDDENDDDEDKDDGDITTTMTTAKMMKTKKTMKTTTTTMTTKTTTSSLRISLRDYVDKFIENVIQKVDSTYRQSVRVGLTTVQRPPQAASAAPRRGCMRNPNLHEKP